MTFKQTAGAILLWLAFFGCAVAEPLYVPLPVFVEKALVFSNRAYLLSSGKKFDMPIELFMASSGGEYPSLRAAIAALQQGDTRRFSSVASPDAFARTSQGVGGYFSSFHDTWVTLREKRLNAVVRFGEIELAVFSAAHGHRTVFPLLVFKYDETGKALMVPGDSGVTYNVLMIWAAGLAHAGGGLLQKKEFDGQSAGSRLFSILLDPDGAKMPEGRRKTLVLLTDEKRDKSAAGAANSVLSKLKSGARRSIEQARSSDFRAILSKYYSSDSAAYLSALSTGDMARYLEQVADSTPVGWINLGPAQAVMMKQEQTGLVGLWYVARIDGDPRIVNVGRASPIDSFLLSRSVIDGAAILAAAVGW